MLDEAQAFHASRYARSAEIHRVMQCRLRPVSVDECGERAGVPVTDPASARGGWLGHSGDWLVENVVTARRHGLRTSCSDSSARATRA